MDHRLAWLLRREPDTFHALDELAAPLGDDVSQIARSLKALEGRGFTFDHHPTLGVRLAGAPAALDRDEIAFARRGGCVGRRVQVYDSTASTNDVAARLAAAGPNSDGTVILAEEQTAGRGRQGAPWFGSRGESLLMSVIHWATSEADAAAELTLAAGVAAAEAVGRTAGLTPNIKWPNDIELGRRKVAGILVERGAAVSPGARLGDPGQAPFIIGIGLNVNQPATRFPAEIAAGATSLCIAAGRRIDRTVLAVALLEQIESSLGTLGQGEQRVLLDRYAAHSDMLGRRVELREGQRTHSGVVASISPHYALVLRLDGGEYRSFSASHVRVL